MGLPDNAALLHRYISWLPLSVSNSTPLMQPKKVTKVNARILPFSDYMCPHCNKFWEALGGGVFNPALNSHTPNIRLSNMTDDAHLGL